MCEGVVRNSRSADEVALLVGCVVLCWMRERGMEEGGFYAVPKDQLEEGKGGRREPVGPNNSSTDASRLEWKGEGESREANKHSKEPAWPTPRQNCWHLGPSQQRVGTASFEDESLDPIAHQMIHFPLSTLTCSQPQRSLIGATRYGGR